jgi:hypothetical protein
VDGGIIDGDAKPPFLGGGYARGGTGSRRRGTGRKKGRKGQQKEKGEKTFHVPE